MSNSNDDRVTLETVDAMIDMVPDENLKSIFTDFKAVVKERDDAERSLSWIMCLLAAERTSKLLHGQMSENAEVDLRAMIGYGAHLRHVRERCKRTVRDIATHLGIEVFYLTGVEAAAFPPFSEETNTKLWGYLEFTSTEYASLLRLRQIAEEAFERTNKNLIPKKVI